MQDRQSWPTVDGLLELSPEQMREVDPVVMNLVVAKRIRPTVASPLRRTTVFLFTLLSIVGCRDAARPTTPSQVMARLRSEAHGQGTSVAGEATDSLEISIGITQQDSKHYGEFVFADVPKELRVESLQLLRNMMARCKIDGPYRPIQRDWHATEDIFVAYYQPKHIWARYSIKVFGLEASVPTLEVTESLKDAPNPRANEPAIPPVIKGGSISLQGEAAQEMYSFLLSVISREEHPDLADWLTQRIAKESARGGEREQEPAESEENGK